MINYTVGTRYPQMANGNDAFIFDIIDNQMTLLQLINSPTSKELSAIRSGSMFSIGMVEAKDVIFIVGDLGNGTLTFDAPYTPHLRPVNTAALGNALAFYSFDSGTGELLNIRLLGIDTKFINDFRVAIAEIQSRDFDPNGYRRDMAALFSLSRQQLMARCSALYVLQDGQSVSVTSASSKVKASRYPGLNSELNKWYEYLPDAGHCIYVVPLCFQREASGNEKDYQVPVPVKYVLKTGYTVVNGYVFCEVQYDESLGAIVPVEFEEF